MPSRIPLPDTIHEDRIVAVLRAPTSEYMVPVALALYDLGVRALEVTLSTPGAIDVIKELRRALGPDACLGAGTVLTTEDVKASAEAGATYLLSPVTDEKVLNAAIDHGLPFVTGAATATEILQGWNLGASAVKVFPAKTLGGPGFIKSILDPLPHVALLPTGGIEAAHVSDYLNAGALAIGAGSPLTGDALKGGSTVALAERVRAFLATASGKSIGATA
jgi:2-dehydro-3-deoxyphosphogluconate aldolase/(4S)-4-hydroxy-2-oxoglutarate aldolase